ncbi:uncharacterized protein LOC113855836 [Abrus precatorius]|uniref:Uncharacterized protein LOC113855836 n=1 Tax=Abrus precatorius TaxID=3816 RepID=A0A8B8KHL3_ABRPR|nr:uncharacterized protein LOC113855836 [Abrus precatorius]
MRGTNGSKLTSSHILLESPMQLDSKEVTNECLSMPPVDDQCLSESKADATADFCGVKDVGSALHNSDFMQCFSPVDNLDYGKSSNHSGCTSQQFGVLNEECMLTTPPDAEIYGNSKVNVDQLESTPHDVNNCKPMELTKNTREKAGEGFCLKADKGKDSLNRQSVRGQHLHRKLFKAPGSVSYKRLLPFLMDLTKDDSGTSKFGHQTNHQKDEVGMSAKSFQLPFSSKSEEASIDEPKTDSSPMHGTVESNAVANNILVNSSNELCHGSQPKLTPSEDLPELPMQMDAKEAVIEGLSAPAVKKAIEKFVIGSKDGRLSESKFDTCSVMVDNFHCAKNVANGEHNDGFKQVQNRISGQHRSESPPKNQNILDINGDVSDHTFEHHASQEKKITINYDQRKQFVNLEERESVRRSSPDCQCLTLLNPKMLDAEENGTGSHAISRSDDSVVLNHVQVSNEEPTSPYGKNIPESSDMAGYGGDETGNVLNAIVFGSRMTSNGSDDKNASDIEYGSESKTTSVLNGCSRVKLLKHSGSFNYKRLLPFLLNIVKDNSCNSGTQQQTGLRACDLNNDSSSPKSQIPEFHSSHGSCKAIQLQDEQVVLSGQCQSDSYTDPSISVHGMDLPITLSATVINDVITREEKTTRASSKSSVISEVKGNSSFLISSNEKPTETRECCQSLSQLRVPAVSFKKGILKRNPRGCRGICACLNCVSFRLHAERAFEFSRNQLLDAEEVARDLMKELSDLRNMLKRSMDSVKNSPVFCGSQVKEACSKAFAAEQLAKDRLIQMNDDLNIHCRITSLQRPRVTFADHVEEKVIQPGG